MQHGGGRIGHSKHRKAFGDKKAKSPRMRLYERMEAEKNERKARNSNTKWHKSVKELIKDK